MLQHLEDCHKLRYIILLWANFAKSKCRDSPASVALSDAGERLSKSPGKGGRGDVCAAGSAVAGVQ